MSARPCALALFCTALLAKTALAQTPQYTVHDLGTGVNVNGINNSGQVVGCFFPLQHAFRTAPNAAPNPATDDLGTLGGAASCAWGINASGQVVGASNAPSGEEHGFRTAPNAVINPATDDIGTLSAYPTRAYRINDSGQVVGESAGRPFRTAPNSPINPVTDDITPPGLTGGRALGINANGDATGDAAVSTSIIREAWVYQNGAGATIPCMGSYPGFNSTGINDLGQIAGTDLCSDLSKSVGVWQNGTITDLFVCQFCPPFGINNSASLQFVGQVESVNPNYAYLYTGGTVYNLNGLIPSGSGWFLSIAQAINDGGQIIGYGTLNGESHAFRLDPVDSTTTVSISVKPGEDSAPINTQSRGTLRVAILSTADFDATTAVDRGSLTFGHAGTEPSLAFCNAGGGDINGDGLADLICHFSTQLAGFKPGDTAAQLNGKSSDGDPIQGRSSVLVIR